MSRFQDHTAEAWVLGALLDADGPVLRSDPQALIGAAGLTDADFTRADFRAFFGAIRALADRNRPADPQTVLATCAGAAGVTPNAYATLTALRGRNEANKAAYLVQAERLRKLSSLRQLEAFLGNQLAALGKADADPAKLGGALNTFAQGFCGTAEPDETGTADLFAITEDWDAYVSGTRETYLRTGIDALDEEVGGLVNNLNVIGGMPSIGKTALAHTIILNCLARGVKVGLFGLEDGTRPLAERFLALRLGIPLGAVAASRLNEFQQERLAQESETLHRMLGNLLAYRRAGITPDELAARCKRWVLHHGCQLLVVDHGGEVQHGSASARDRHDLAVAETYRQLRDLAVNHRVPVLVLSHLTRKTEDSGRPTMQSFAESAYIERMARLALGLWEVPGKAHELRVTVLKRTKGRRGSTLALNRSMEAGLIKSIGGYLVDEDAEKADREQQAREAQRASVPRIPKRAYP